MRTERNCGPFLPEFVYNKKENPIECPRAEILEREHTNAHFAKNDTVFQEACSAAGVPASTRQASKWKNKTGLAYLYFQYRNKESIMETLDIKGFINLLTVKGGQNGTPSI